MRPSTSKPERTGNWIWDWGFVLIVACVLVAILIAATAGCTR
jgi:hypothetical protein